MPSVRDRGTPRLRRGVPSETGLGGPPELAPQVLTARESRDATAAPRRPERKGGLGGARSWPLKSSQRENRGTPRLRRGVPSERGAWGVARAGPSSPHSARIEGRHGCAE